MMIPTPPRTPEEHLLFEASLENETLENLEHRIQQLGPSYLQQIPLIALHQIILKSDSEELAQFLPKLSTEQRLALLDFDFWNKDNPNLETFYKWPLIYQKVKDENTLIDFIESDTFSLFLLKYFAIGTFDAENPNYPDHDHFFTTPDDLLLIECKEDEVLLELVKRYINIFYDLKGVEIAYSHLFNLVSESYLTMEEQLYQDSVYRLKVMGVPNYYEALELLQSRQTSNTNVPVKKIITQSIPPLEIVKHLRTPSEYANWFTTLPVEDQSFLVSSLGNLTNCSYRVFKELCPGKESHFAREYAHLLQLCYQWWFENMPTEINPFKPFKEVKGILEKNISQAKEFKKNLQSSFLGKNFQGSYFDELLQNLNTSSHAKVILGLKNKITLQQFHFVISTLNSYFKLQAFFCEILAINYRATAQSYQLNPHYYFNYFPSELDIEWMLLTSFAQFAWANAKGEIKADRIGIEVSELLAIHPRLKGKTLQQQFVHSLNLSSTCQVALETLLTIWLERYLDQIPDASAKPQGVKGFILIRPPESAC